MMNNAVIMFVAIGIAQGGVTPAMPTASMVVASMVARDNERLAMLKGYTSSRRYVLENRARNKRAEMQVQVTCREDGSKEFKIVSSTGWGAVRKHVFPRLLEAEADAARPERREQSRIVPENYDFELTGIENIRGRTAYVLSIEPKTANQYLMRGTIWVDAEDYAIVRVDGHPAKSPSFWIKSVHFTHEYDKKSIFWFPVLDRSVTDVRILGASEMTIEYFDYWPSGTPPAPTQPGGTPSH
jgi:outer membrane lipoprotein-sorting protein